MAPKKKGTGKKKTPTPPMDPFVFEMPAVASGPSEYVACRIVNIALPHLNFEWPAVPTEVTLSVIKGAIGKRHGGSALDLKLYNEVPSPSTLITLDDGASLKDMGIKGIISGTAAQMPIVTIVYDFSPPRPEDIIVSNEIDVSKSAHGIDLKKYLQQAHAQGIMI